jgi:uncharacterized protein DUF6958
MAGAEEVAMENPNSPGRVFRVDADKYHAMKDAMLAVLPRTAPGPAFQIPLETISTSLPSGESCTSESRETCGSASV